MGVSRHHGAFVPKILSPTFWILGLIGITLGLSPSSLATESCFPKVLRAEHTSQHLLTSEKLKSEIASRRAQVPEFEFIRQEAAKRGFRVWLHGGTAAAYAHYVKWDLLRESGDPRFVVPQGGTHRFDYDYTNIYRSTQDLDIVVEG